MDFNLALVLTSLTAISGLFVALNYFWYKPLVDNGRMRQIPMMDVVVEYSRSFFPVLLFVLIIRSFIFEPFRIPSGSMMPTLVQGDYIFVKKFSYGLRLPVLEAKILETGSPERGDVVVFRLPSDTSINYIKRVIGLPGDEVVYRNQRLFVNGEAVNHVPSINTELRGADLYTDGEFVRTLEPDAIIPGRELQPFTETLGEREHAIFLQANTRSSKDGVFRVPEGHYFMMGDNRDRSKDSRWIDAVPETHLVGEAVLVWMHLDHAAREWQWPNWARIGTSIQ